MDESAQGSEPSIHVLFRKEDLDPARIAGKTVIVVDVLFATTSIIAALDAGAEAVYPALDADEARALAGRDDLRSPVLAGEYNFRFIEGFARPTPVALRRSIDPGNSLVYATTNGTVALRACAGARRVMAGALTNAGATVRALDADRTVVILCAGSAGAFNIEDFYGAGCLVQRVSEQWPHYRITDAASAARHHFQTSDAGTVLRESLVGRLMLEWGLDEEVAFASCIDHSETVAELVGDRIAAGLPFRER